MIKSVFRTRPSPAGVNIPATTNTPNSAATADTAEAHGPSSGSATGSNGRPNLAIIASGKTTIRAPSRTADATPERRSFRFSPGSSPELTWHNAIRGTAFSLIVGRQVATEYPRPATESHLVPWSPC